MMKNRRSLRLQNYDYSQSGAYFVTICTHNRQLLFGDIVNGEMVLNEFGEIVKQSWLWLAKQYAYIVLDEFVIMPNHMHGILTIRRGDSRTAPTTTTKRKPLGRLIGALKTVSTKQINQLRGTFGQKVWQRNYYEHIVRNEADLLRIREYIVNNPMNWHLDSENPLIPR